MYDIVLPGRGKRMVEPARGEWAPLVEDLAAALSEALKDGAPYAFVGFAFGAVLAYETALAMTDSAPCLLAAISAEAPSWKGWAAPKPGALLIGDNKGGVVARTETHKLSDEDFEAALRRRGGPRAISLLDEPELKSMFLPTLRANAQLEETYTFLSGAERMGNIVTAEKMRTAKKIPVLAFYGAQPGRDDERTRTMKADVEPWLEMPRLMKTKNSKVSDWPVMAIQEHDWYMLEPSSDRDDATTGAKEVLEHVKTFFNKVVLPKLPKKQGVQV